MEDTLVQESPHPEYLPPPESQLRVVPDAPDDPTHLIESMAVAAVEVLSGHRSVRQMQRWLAPHLYIALAQRAGIAARCGKRMSLPARVISSRTCFPAPMVCEAAIVVWDVNRPRACTIRMEIHRGRWRANALDVI